METKGIRILDSINDVVSVKLGDILNVVQNGDSLNWTILCLDVILMPEGKKDILSLEKQSNETEKGLNIDWLELKLFAEIIHQEIDLTVIGCKDKRFLHRYKNDVEMYENCDIVIEMIDSSYWEVFSKDTQLIQRLAVKFKEIKFLEPDFER